MDPVETYEYAGCVVEIHYDEDPMDPRGDCQLGVMICGHPEYQLGDVQAKDSDYAYCHTAAELEAALKLDGAKCVLPLVLLDHSGLTMRVGTSFAEDPGGWDTSLVGVIYTDDEHQEVVGTPDDLLEECLRGEVSEYASYLEGD